MNDKIEGKEKVVYLPIFVGVDVGMDFFMLYNI